MPEFTGRLTSRREAVDGDYNRQMHAVLDVRVSSMGWLKPPEE